MAVPGMGSFEQLTWRHAVKIASTASMEDCSLVVGEIVGHDNIQTLQDFAMLRSHQFTRIQRFPANSVRRGNFNTSPQLSRKFHKLLSSPTTFSLPLHQGRKFCPVDTVQTLAEFSSVVNNENGYTRHGNHTHAMYI